MTISLVKDSVVLMVGRGLGLVIAVITPFILVRMFSVDAYGEYRQVMLLVTTVAGILPLGLPQSLYYFIPHYPLEKGIYISRTIIFIFFVAVFLCLLVTIFKPLFGDFFNNVSFVEYAPLAVLVGSLLSLSLVIETVLLVDNNVSLSAKVTVLSRFFRGLVIVACAWFGGVLMVLYGLLFYYFIKFSLSIFYFVKKEYFTLNFKIFTQSIENIRYTLPLFVAGVLMMAISSVDKYFISFISNPIDFAIYSVGCYEFPFIAIFFASIGDVTLPKIVEYKKEGNIEKLLQLWRVSIEKSLLIGIPLYIFSFIFADKIIIALFTDKYIAAIPIFRIFLAQVLLESTRYGSIVRGLGKTGMALYATIVPLVLLVPGCYLGMKIGGLPGIAFAVIIANIIHAGIQLWWSAAALNIRKIDIFPVKSAVCMIFVSVVISVVIFFGIVPVASWGINGLVLLGLQFMVFITAYVFTTNYFGLWCVDELPVSVSVKQKIRCLFIC